MEMVAALATWATTAGSSAAAASTAATTTAATSAAATTAGATAATGAAAGAGGLFTASNLALASGAMGAFSTFATGLSQKRASEDAAYQAGLDARQASLQGTEEGNEILDRVIDTIAKNRVAFAAAGVDGTRGSARDSLNRTIERGERSVRTAGDNGFMRRLQSRYSQRALRRQGGEASLAGAIAGAGQVAGVLADRRERG